MIIRGGENIYPTEIEQFLHRHPKIQEVEVGFHDFSGFRGVAIVKVSVRFNRVTVEVDIDLRKWR